MNILKKIIKSTKINLDKDSVTFIITHEAELVCKKCSSFNLYLHLAAFDTHLDL